MIHVLDNPIFNALTSGNKNLSEGSGDVRFFSRDVAPFVGMRNNTPDEFARLYEILPFKGNFAIFTPAEVEIPGPWKINYHLNLLQMVYEAETPLTGTEVPVALGEEDIPAMIALTQLTTPGPFFSRTIDFGNYLGLFEGDQLVSLAGQRLQPSPYIEISAVCTHPEHLGKGYASKLLKEQIRLIRQQGNIPFLHVLKDNLSAVNVYKRLGFTVRREMLVYSFHNQES